MIVQDTAATTLHIRVPARRSGGSGCRRTRRVRQDLMGREQDPIGIVMI